MAKKSHKKQPTFETEEEPNLTKGMGILPNDVSFTQNIGCVGSKSKADKNTKSTQ